MFLLNYARTSNSSKNKREIRLNQQNGLVSGDSPNFLSKCIETYRFFLKKGIFPWKKNGKECFGAIMITTFVLNLADMERQKQ